MMVMQDGFGKNEREWMKSRLFNDGPPLLLMFVQFVTFNMYYLF